jgi:hypothetical protein
VKDKRFTYGLLGVLALIVVVAAVSPAITGDAMRSRLSRQAFASATPVATDSLPTTYDTASLGAQSLYSTTPPVVAQPDPQEAKWCQETDGGRDYGTKGTTDAWNGTGTDSCNNAGRIIEWYCDNDLGATSSNNNCGQGFRCVDGACIHQP